MAQVGPKVRVCADSFARFLASSCTQTTRIAAPDIPAPVLNRRHFLPRPSCPLRALDVSFDCKLRTGRTGSLPAGCDRFDGEERMKSSPPRFSARTIAFARGSKVKGARVDKKPALANQGNRQEPRGSGSQSRRDVGSAVRDKCHQGSETALASIEGSRSSKKPVPNSGRSSEKTAPPPRPG
jgi:hypothetical protein